MQINASDGGVPKWAIRTATIGERGIDADRQADLVHHGSRDQALCIYALESIVELQSEGHPIYPGSIGENITTCGIDLGRIDAGTQLTIGDEVRIEITGYATPCSKIAESFSGGEFIRVSQKVNPGWSRLYARVCTPGSIRIGDSIAIVASAGLDSNGTSHAADTNRREGE